MSITIQKEGEKWVARFEDKYVAQAGCKGCLIKTLLSVTKKSKKYRRLIVKAEDGSVEKIYPLVATA